MSLPKTLFLSRGSNAVSWYRCALPALALDTDWICYDSAEPPATKLIWGRTQNPLEPQKGAEFVAQMAQFNTLEQLIAIRAELVAIRLAAQPPVNP